MEILISLFKRKSERASEGVGGGGWGGVERKTERSTVAVQRRKRKLRWGSFLLVYTEGDLKSSFETEALIFMTCFLLGVR